MNTCPYCIEWNLKYCLRLLNIIRTVQEIEGGYTLTHLLPLEKKLDLIRDFEFFF